MKRAIVYLIGAIILVFSTKLSSITLAKTNKIKTPDDKYTIEPSEEILQSEDIPDINVINTIPKNNTKDKVELIDEIETVAVASAEMNKKIEVVANAEINKKTDVAPNAELDNIGFARNYDKKTPELTTWESIAYSIDYFKSKISSSNKDGGFYGNLGLIYIYDTYDDGKRQSKQSNFKQEYSLGHRGVVYSSKLLKYSLSTTIRYEDIKDKVNNIINETKVESYDYKANLNFLRHTKIPFTISATKTQRPSYTLYNNTRNESTYDNTSLGLNGQLNLKIFKLSYSVSDSQGTYEDVLSSDYREDRTYRTTLTKETDNQNIRIYYDNTNQVIDRVKTSVSTLSNIENESINLYYRAKLSSSVRFDAQSSYRVNNYSDNLLGASQTQSTLANLNLSWNPKGKHQASFGISGTSIKDINAQQNIATNIDNINLAQSYGYRMSKNISISQSSGYGIVVSDLNTIENINFSSGISYRKKIATGATLSISANANINNNSNDSDSNTTIKEITSYTYAVGAGINQMLPAIKSRINVDFKYNGTISTTDETRQSYSADFGMNTNIYSTLRNQLKINYYSDTSKSLGTTNTITSINSNRISMTNELNHATRIGIKGTLNSKISIQYLSTQTNGDKIDTLIPKADIIFRYRLGQKLNHISKFNLYKEIFYDTTNYSFASDFMFKTGKLSASIGYIYNKTMVGGDATPLNIDTHRINMKFNRRF